MVNRSLRIRYTMWLIVVGAIWGFSFTLSVIATRTGAHSFTVTFWQAVVATCCLLAIGWFTGERLVWTRQLSYLVCVVGIVGVSIPNIIYYTAAPLVSAGVLSLSTAVIPIATLLLSVPLGLDRFSSAKMIGLAMGIVGVLMIVVPSGSLEDRSDVFWVLVALFSSVCYAVENIAFSIWLKDNPAPITVTGVGFGVAALVMMIPNILSGEFTFLTVPLDDAELAMIALGVGSSGAFIGYVYLIRRAGSVFASLTSFLVVIAGVFWGMLILGERHSLWIWGALVLILCSVAWVQPLPNPKGQPVE
ncbi:MAG: DMT family transporter [Phototrophicaceae bacterium]